MKRLGKDHGIRVGLAMNTGGNCPFRRKTGPNFVSSFPEYVVLRNCINHPHGTNTPLDNLNRVANKMA